MEHKASSWRLNQIEKAREKRTNPFNEEIYNEVIKAMRKIANYCEIKGCENCQIKNDLHCNGNTNQMDSPFHWFDTD